MARSNSFVLGRKLLTSGLIAQMASLVSLAFAANQTTPDDFARFGMIMAGTGVIASVNTLAAETRATVVSGAQAEAITRAGSTACAAFALLIVIGSLMTLPVGQDWVVVGLFIGGCGFLVGLQQLLSGIVLREEKQELLARSRLVQGLSNALLIVALLLTPMNGEVALGLAWLVSLALGDAVIARGVVGWSMAFRTATRDDFRSLISEVKWQPVSNLLVSSTGSFPLLFLPLGGAIALAGAWALASRFLLPVVNLAQVVLTPVYYGRAAAYYRAEEYESFRTFHMKWMVGLLVAGVPVLIGIFVCIEWFIPALGAEWDIARNTLVPACIFFTSLFVWLPLSQTLILQGRVNAQFAWTVLRFVACLAPFALLGRADPDVVLLGWAVASAATIALHNLWQRSIVSPGG